MWLLLASDTLDSAAPRDDAGLNELSDPIRKTNLQGTFRRQWLERRVADPGKRRQGSSLICLRDAWIRLNER